MVLLTLGGQGRLWWGHSPANLVALPFTAVASPIWVPWKSLWFMWLPLCGYQLPPGVSCPRSSWAWETEPAPGTAGIQRGLFSSGHPVSLTAPIRQTLRVHGPAWGFPPELKPEAQRYSFLLPHPCNHSTPSLKYIQQISTGLREA